MLLLKKLPLHLAIGALLLISTLLGYYVTRKSLRDFDDVRFESAARRTEHFILGRMETYINTLLQTRSMFYVTHDVDEKEFREYVASLELTKKYPGFQGIGFTLRIPRAQLPAHVREMRKSGRPDYKVWPETLREEYFSILYLEPMDWRNKRAIGFDMYTDAIRRTAMDRARESGTAAMSGVVELVQETDNDPQPGFLIYVPVYGADRSQLLGYVYSPFRSKDLFEQIVPTLRENAIDVEVISVEDGKFVFDRYDDKSYEADLVTEETFTLAQKKWLIRVKSMPAFRQSSSELLPLIILLLGSLMSFLVTWFLIRNSRLYEEAKKAVEAREEFLSIASHELKTPITSLKLQFQTAKRMIEAGHDKVYEQAAVQKRVATALKQLDKMVKLIDDMLDSSRISMKKLTMASEVFDLRELMDEIIDRYKENLANENISYSYRTVDEKVLIRGDEYRLEQVVTNLINNAIKYGDKKPIALELKATKTESIITVEDHGIGIAPEGLKHIFERYVRIKSNNNVTGLGLGLYISCQIVQAHHGSIRAESDPGVRTVFTVTLPRVENV